MNAPNYDYHCYAVLVYAEADETFEEKDLRITSEVQDDEDYSYYSFLTPEASMALDRYHVSRKEMGEVFTDDTPIFRTLDNGIPYYRENIIQMNGHAFEQRMQTIIKRTTIKRIKKRNRYDIQLDHGYRKRFNTILKIDSEVNSNIAEKLMHHKKGLDGTYLTPTRNECFVEFVKAIPELTIDQKIKQQQMIKEQQEEISKMEKQKTQIGKLEEENSEQGNQIEMLKDELERQRLMINSIKDAQK